MAQSDADKWNARYSDRGEVNDSPVSFLVDNVHRLGAGKALVLAAGTGRNAVYLAEQGFDVAAVDVSRVGLDLCEELAKKRNVVLQTVCADLDSFDLGGSEYDLITKDLLLPAVAFSCHQASPQTRWPSTVPNILEDPRPSRHLRPT